MANILIVDDQRSVLLTLEALLKKHGHGVTACLNVIEAIQALGQQSFDLVITDAIMPGGSDGYTLIKAIRKNPTISKIPIILLTGKREKEDIQKGIEVGVNDYVVKPLDPELLMGKISHLLALDNADSSHFAEAAVGYSAELSTKIEITAVSELGLNLTSNLPLPSGKIFRLKSKFFDEVGIDVLPLRVVSCDEVVGSDDVYKVKAHFVGITEKELAPIRLWIRSKKSHF